MRLLLQRRLAPRSGNVKRLAAMKTWGYDYLQLWRSLLSGGSNIDDHRLSRRRTSRHLRARARRPLAEVDDQISAPFAFGAGQVVLTLSLVICIALVVISLPGFIAARVSPSVSFQE